MTEDDNDILTDEDIESALREAFRKGLAQGRRVQREETLGLLEFATQLNGSGKATVQALRKAWQEDRHPRDHGKFASKGESDGVQGKEASSETDSRGVAAHVGADAAQGRDPDEHARSLASRIREVPAHVVNKVRAWVQGRYQKLAARYGEMGAKAVLGAMVLLSPTPIPGSSLIPVAIAEAVLRIRTAIGKGMEPDWEMVWA